MQSITKSIKREWIENTKYRKWQFKFEKRLKGVPCIYILFKKEYGYTDKVLYIGQSTNVYSRINTHLKRKYFKWTHFKIIILRHIRDMDTTESILIKFLHPRGNTNTPIKKVKTISIDDPEYSYDNNEPCFNFPQVCNQCQNEMLAY